MYCIKKKKPAPRKSHRIEEQREGERSAGVVKRYGHHSDSATRRCCVLVLSNKTRRAPYPRPSMAPLTNLAAVRPCPTFLIKSWSYTRTTPGLPHASEYCGHCAKKKKRSSALSFYFFCPRTKRSGSRERTYLSVNIRNLNFRMCALVNMSSRCAELAKCTLSSPLPCASR